MLNIHIKNIIREVLLEEGLISSCTIEQLVRILSKKFLINNNDIIIENNSLIITLDNQELVDNIKSFILRLGWFCSLVDQNSLNKFDMYIEQKFCNEIKVQDLLEHGINKLCHITPYYNVNKIKRIGFVPKSKNKFLKYPDRIFFLEPRTYELIVDVAHRLYNTHANKDKFDTMAIIMCDLYKIEPNTVFYKDDNLNYGYFTYDNINPICIDKINTLKCEICDEYDLLNYYTPLSIE